MSSPRPWLALGGLYGLLSVAFGAFGAHALHGRISDPMLAIFRTAVDYQFFHALALVVVGVWMLVRPSAGLARVGACFALGVLVFSGSLYGFSLSGWRPWAYVTPFGGLLFLLGWMQVIVVALRTT